MSQDSIRELINNSAINAVKLLTSNQSMKQINFFKVSDVPNRLKLYDIMIKLQKDCKLNFITCIYKCQSQSNIRSFIVACRNAAEFNAFIARGDMMVIKGYHLKIEASRRPLGINLVKIPEEMKKHVDELSRVISYDAATSYSKVFPTERILEILIEMQHDEWIVNGMDGISIKYNHHERKLGDKVIILVDKTVDYNAVSRFLMEYGNKNIKNWSTKMIITFKFMWQRENVYEINELEEAIYVLTKELLERDMLSNDRNFNDIRSALE